MKILEVEIKLPYKNRGPLMTRLLSRLSDRIRDLHLLPPNATGMSELRMELVGGKEIIKELKEMIKNGKISFRVLSEA